MRIALRFLIPLLLVLGGVAWAATPLLGKLIEQWLRADVEMRSQLVFDSVQDTVVRNAKDPGGGQIDGLFHERRPRRAPLGAGTVLPRGSPDLPLAHLAAGLGMSAETGGQGGRRARLQDSAPERWDRPHRGLRPQRRGRPARRSGHRPRSQLHRGAQRQAGALSDRLSRRARPGDRRHHRRRRPGDAPRLGAGGAQGAGADREWWHSRPGSAPGHCAAGPGDAGDAAQPGRPARDLRCHPRGLEPGYPQGPAQVGIARGRGDRGLQPGALHPQPGGRYHPGPAPGQRAGDRPGARRPRLRRDLDRPRQRFGRCPDRRPQGPHPGTPGGAGLHAAAGLALRGRAGGLLLWSRPTRGSGPCAISSSCGPTSAPPTGRSMWR